jgi:hypothetical protein
MAQNINNHSWLMDAEGKSLELRADGVTRLGRASDNDIVLEDITVSQHHAVISFDRGRAFLRDLGSSNGTFIEGSRVTGGELGNGSAIRLGRAPLVYRDSAGAYSAATLVSVPRNQDRTRTAPSQRNFSLARTGSVLGSLFLLGLVATLAGRHLFFSSSSSVGSSSFGNLVDSRSYRLPDASSDFVGDWCGWAHVVSCEPAGSCDEELAPESMGFKSDSGGVLMHYAITGAQDTRVGSINVHVLDSRHVRVTYVERGPDSNSGELFVDGRHDIVSVNSTLVRCTTSSTFNLNGVTARREEDLVELTKCTAEFRASQEKFMQEKNMVEKGDVNGSIPSN